MKQRKEELHVNQTTKPSWAIKTYTKLVDWEDRYRRSNLTFEGVKEHENESWEDYKNKIYDLLEKNIEMDIEYVVIERVHRIGKKNKNRSQPSCLIFILKEQKGYLKPDKTLKNPRFSIFVDFSREAAAIGKETRSSCQ